MPANPRPRGREHPSTEVTFCVQGVITPPCGVPLSRSTRALQGAGDALRQRAEAEVGEAHKRVDVDLERILETPWPTRALA
jgi:hypothetical protein